jgi:hypothetical protein
MPIYCTLKRTASNQQTEYRVIDASHGFAHIEKRNPAWTEDPAAFDVPVSEIAVVWQEDEFGRAVITHEDEEALSHPHLM